MLTSENNIDVDNKRATQRNNDLRHKTRRRQQHTAVRQKQHIGIQKNVLTSNTKRLHQHNKAKETKQKIKNITKKREAA